MKVIPVIDYMHGHVVLAQHGERTTYKPVASLLCSDSDVSKVIDSILSFMNFNTIYIADLDAIGGLNHNISTWQNICSKYPAIEFWLDIGKHASSWQDNFTEVSNLRPIIGTEAFMLSQQINTLVNQLEKFRPIISLDFKKQVFLGPENFIHECSHWPNDIIVLDLAQIGHVDGADLQFYSSLINQLPNSSAILMGGGIRNIDDLKQVQVLGLSGALVATALHNKTISQSALAELITHSS